MTEEETGRDRGRNKHKDRDGDKSRETVRCLIKFAPNLLNSFKPSPRTSLNQ